MTQFKDFAGRRKAKPTKVTFLIGNRSVDMKFDSLQAASRATGVPTMCLLQLIRNNKSLPFIRHDDAFVKHLVIEKISYLED